MISLHNECRELLFLLGENNTSDPEIECVELDDIATAFCFHFREEENIELKTGAINNFIFDPYAAITKAGAFKSVAEKFILHAIHANTHVYTGDTFISNFPGRIFEVKTILSYDPKKIMALFPDKKATIIIRNFPVESTKVLKQLPLKSDIKNYIFLVTDCDGNAVAVAAERKL